MDIELIVIGSELLNGKIQEVNAHWLARFLAQKAMCLYQVTVVHDSEFELAEALITSYQRSDVVITTGGLGPTEDDITKKILAQVFNKEIKYNEQAIEVVTENYKYFEKIPHLRKNGYANLPEDFIPIHNPCGLAPGLVYKDAKKNKLIISGPGVPHEFQQMFEKNLFDFMTEYGTEPDERSEIITVRTRNIPEETIFFDLCPDLWEDLSEYGAVSSLPHPLGVDLVVKYTYTDENDKKNTYDGITKVVMETPLKDAVWHIGDLTLEDVIFNMAKEKSLTLAAAESATGGRIADRLTNVAGSSETFLGSAITYSIESKNVLLGVDKTVIEEKGVVSEEVAAQMASGAREKYAVDLAVSVTGIAGPSGGTANQPVGTVCIGIASPHQCIGRTFHFKGDREQLKSIFSQMALYLVYEELENWDKPRAEVIIEDAVGEEDAS